MMKFIEHRGLRVRTDLFWLYVKIQRQGCKEFFYDLLCAVCGFTFALVVHSIEICSNKDVFRRQLMSVSSSWGSASPSLWSPVYSSRQFFWRTSGSHLISSQ